jgi:hypothetical protein
MEIGPIPTSTNGSWFYLQNSHIQMQGLVRLPHRVIVGLTIDNTRDDIVILGRAICSMKAKRGFSAMFF